MLGGGKRKISGKKTNGKKTKSDDRARKFCRALLFDLLTKTLPHNEDMLTPDEQQEAIKKFWTEKQIHPEYQHLFPPKSPPPSDKELTKVATEFEPIYKLLKAQLNGVVTKR